MNRLIEGFKNKHGKIFYSMVKCNIKLNTYEA